MNRPSEPSGLSSTSGTGADASVAVAAGELPRAAAPRVLVVDDDRSSLDVLVDVLRPHYRVSAVLGGAAALRLATSEARPDLILLDGLMPGLDGFEVASRLRADPRTQEVPVIFLTSLDRVEDEVRAFEHGAVDFISKPVVPAVVLARVATHLELRARRRELQTLNVHLEEKNHQITTEQERADSLLRNILPRRIIEDLKQSGRTTPELFPEVSVVFTDIVDFTRTSARVEPRRLIDELSSLFDRFDAVVARHRGERIKTIGDAYLAVCGMPDSDPGHAANMVAAALELVACAEERNRRCDPDVRFEIRAGVHSGPAVGGVVGTTKYIYDVFGDTINTASRMQQLSEPMRVNVSESTRALAGPAFAFEPRGLHSVKGKGELPMFFVSPRRDVAP